MRLKQEVKVLHTKALSSVRWATASFNSPDDDGRPTRVLLGFQHAFEMLLKAALVHSGKTVFDKKLGRSLGFEDCVKLAVGNATIRLTPEEAGTVRAIDALRDDEQHWFNQVSEQLLYIHARAAITLFDDILERVFGQHLADFLPGRVLPISVDAPRNLDLLMDEEYSQIRLLLAPGRRARHEARARIRTLLAMEAHLDSETRVSSKDVDRVEKGIRSGQDRHAVFPVLEKIGTMVAGEGVSVKVHFTKKQGAAVHFVADAQSAAAIREVDLQKKFHRSASDLAASLGISQPKSLALRKHLGIDADTNCRHEFVFGAQKISGFSDNALLQMRRGLDSVEMKRVWEAHRPSLASDNAGSCSEPNCANGALERAA